MIAVAIAVRLEGGPGILFRQERVGADGQRFDVLKFRSLKPANDEESATNWNIKHDDRLGPVGRFLRKTSIDELPAAAQHPARRDEPGRPAPGAAALRRPVPADVPPVRRPAPRAVRADRAGRQVHGLRGDTSIADRAMFDNYYIENWSLWLDVKIMLRTVGSVDQGTGRLTPSAHGRARGRPVAG